MGGLDYHTSNIKPEEVSEEDKHSNRMCLIISPWGLSYGKSHFQISPYPPNHLNTSNTYLT